MKTLKSLVIISLVGLVISAPSSHDNRTLLITRSLYPDRLVQYTGEHEIINILLPINSLNVHEPQSSEFESNSDEDDLSIIYFFAEADTDANGNRVDHGLYVMKHGEATKILENGRDAAASTDDSKLVFFGAKDGIYVYNEEKNSADKYGTIDDNIIGIAKERTGDIIYILTESHEVFKVSNNGTTKEKLDDVVNAKQIVLDYSNNIYFYSDDKQVYVRTADGVKKITGLPENPANVNLIKPPFILKKAVPFLVDDNLYIIYANGTSKHFGIKFNSDAIPSAFAPETFLTQLYAFEKKIYEYNILPILFGEVLEELRSYVTEMTQNIGPISLRLRNNP